MGIPIVSVAFIIIVLRDCVFGGKTKTAGRNLAVCSALLLAAFFACRNGKVNFGSDLNNYYRFYLRAIHSSSFDRLAETSTFEAGYVFLNYMFGRVIKWPQFIIIFQAVFCIGVTVRFIYKHSKDVMLSVLGFMSLGLLQFYATGFRQSIAISLCLIALELAENRKLIPFIITLLIASRIHQTSIVFAVSYILVRLPVNRKTLAADITAVIVLPQLVPRIIVMGNDVFDKSYGGSFAGNLTGGLINILIAGFIIFIMYKKFDAPDRDTCGINYGFMHILIIGIGIYAMRFQALVLERISLYFTPVMFILLPQVISSGFFNDKDRALVRLLLCAGMLFLLFWRFSNLEFVPFWVQ